LNVLAGLVAFPIAVVQASLFEWAFHRYWLHRPWLPKDCFTSHTLVHHQLCKFDDTFQVHDEEQEEALTFAWWGGPVLISINIIPWVLGMWGLSAAGITPFNFWVLGSVIAAYVLYYIGYEGLHYLMHKPTIAWIERSRYFKFLERHHRIHHYRMEEPERPRADRRLPAGVAGARGPGAGRDSGRRPQARAPAQPVRQAPAR
jgi:hypothetical protein